MKNDDYYMINKKTGEIYLVVNCERPRVSVDKETKEIKWEPMKYDYGKLLTL